MEDMFLEETQLEKDMKAIATAIERSKEHGLQLEVLATAFDTVKKNPEMEVEEALFDALFDWDLI